VRLLEQWMRLASVLETNSTLTVRVAVAADPLRAEVVDVMVTGHALPAAAKEETDHRALAETRRAARDPAAVAEEETVLVPHKSKVVRAKLPLTAIVVTDSLVKSGLPRKVRLELAVKRRTRDRAVTETEATAKTSVTKNLLRRKQRRKRRRRRPRLKLPPLRKPSRRRPRPSPSPRKKILRLSPVSTSPTGRPRGSRRRRVVSLQSSRPVSTLRTPRSVSSRTLRRSRELRSSELL